jgi:hypothetical protein
VVGEQKEHRLGKRATPVGEINQHFEVRPHGVRIGVPRRVSGEQRGQLGQLGLEFFRKRNIEGLHAFLPLNRKTGARLIDRGIERLGVEEPTDHTDAGPEG